MKFAPILKYCPLYKESALKNHITEFTTESHLQGNKYFRVVHGRTDKSHSVGLHRHEFVEVLWVKSGGGLLISGGRERFFSKNFLYISKPCEVHVLDPEGGAPMEFSYIAIAREVVERFMRDILAEENDSYKDGFIGMSAKLTPFETAFLDRAAMELADNGDSLMAIFRFLLNLYWRMRNSLISSLPDDIPDWLRDACQRALNPENLSIGLPKFRRICGKNTSYINRAMRRYMGCTPTEFLNDARLRYAKWLLETSSFSAGKISSMCGFSDLPYFCRKFREKYESTPMEFRKKLRRGEIMYVGECK